MSTVGCLKMDVSNDDAKKIAEVSKLGTLHMDYERHDW